MQNRTWLKEFPALDVVDYQNPDSVVYQFHRTLDAFASNVIPGSNYTIDELIHFVTSLVKRQNDPGKFITWGGNWSMIPKDVSAPSDVRVGLIFFPSYLAVSFLTLFWYRYKMKAELIPGFFEALHDGYFFITARKLFGHGMEGSLERVEAIRILLKGRVHHYLLEKKSSCEQCQALFEVLVRFKADIHHENTRTFESVDLVHKLVDFPNIVLTDTPNFSWCFANRCQGVILEAPYTVAPGHEVATGEIVKDVAAKAGCAAIIGNIPKEEIRYTGTLNQHIEETFLDYHNLLGKIVAQDENPERDRYENLQVLHIVLRGMDDSHGIDVELSNRNGLSCENTILESLVDHLSWGLEGYSRRSYAVTANNLFGGGSKYLDFFCNGYPQRPEINGFGQGYNILEVRLSRTVRDTALGRIKDLLLQFIEGI